MATFMIKDRSTGNVYGPSFRHKYEAVGFLAHGRRIGKLDARHVVVALGVGHGINGRTVYHGGAIERGGFFKNFVAKARRGYRTYSGRFVAKRWAAMDRRTGNSRKWFM